MGGTSRPGPRRTAPVKVILSSKSIAHFLSLTKQKKRPEVGLRSQRYAKSFIVVVTISRSVYLSHRVCPVFYRAGTHLVTESSGSGQRDRAYGFAALMLSRSQAASASFLKSRSASNLLS